MLKKIRTFATNLGTKILMGLLILTFGVWGVGDMAGNNNSNTTVAKVGDIDITAAEYQRGLYNETEKLRQILGKQFSPELVEKFEIGPRVLKRMLDNRLLILESRELGLRISDEDVARHIRKTPAFLDKDGKFSKANFEAILRDNGQNEKTFIKQIREDMAVEILASTILNITVIPENAPAILLSAREEQRNVEIYKISPDFITSVPSPTEDQINEYYKAHSNEFTAPEYRTISYVLLKSEDAKKIAEAQGESQVPEKEIEDAYRGRINEFKKPEMRNIEQLLFGNEEAARKAYDAIKSGKSFAQVGKESNILNPKTISLGAVEKANILEEASDVVFSLDKDAISEPIKSSFGWHIFHVKEIIPARTQSLEEVYPLLEKELEQRVNETAITNITNQLEDAIAGGSTLSEAAREAGLKVITLPPIDRNGLRNDGTIEKNIPQDEKFLETAFKTEEKTESSLISSRNGENYIIRVESVIPEHVRELAEVKPKLIANWIEQQKKQQLSVLAKKIAADFSNPQKRGGIIKSYNLPAPETITLSYKKDSPQKLPANMIADIFLRKTGSSTDAYAQENGNGYIIGVIKDIIPVVHPKDDEKYAGLISNITQEYTSSMQNEIFEQYLRFLATKYPISVNSAALQTKSSE